MRTEADRLLESPWRELGPTDPEPPHFPTFRHAREKMHGEQVRGAISNSKLKVGALNAEGTLQMVRGPYQSQDEAGEHIENSAEVLFYGAPGWWVAVQV